MTGRLRRAVAMILGGRFAADPGWTFAMSREVHAAIPAFAQGCPLRVIRAGSNALNVHTANFVYLAVVQSESMGPVPK